MSSVVQQVRNSSVQYDLTVDSSMPEVFSDGVSQMLMGAGVSKLVFHSVSKPVFPGEENVEQRNGVLRLIIPTGALLEFCKQVIATAQTNVDALSEAGKQIDLQIRSVIGSVEIDKPKL